MNKIRVGVLGGAGYTGGELLRLLIHHPAVSIEFVHSRSHAGSPVHKIHNDLLGDTELAFTDNRDAAVDVVFLCLGHGESKKLLSEYSFAATTHIIDLSQDFRVSSVDSDSFVYGLPELNREKIKQARHIANPGCFATSIQLALLPLAEKHLLRSNIHLTCTTGSTGAGQTLSESSHFSWREGNLSVYKPFTHQHLGEIRRSLAQLQPGFEMETVMVPQRGAFTRGILSCITLNVQEDLHALTQLYAGYYKTHPFVHISPQNINLKQVVNTNKCLLYLEKYEDQLLIVSIIDNLLKGASGQAVQNMNLLFGLEETMGLTLKASAF